MLRDAKAKKDGMDYCSGVAIETAVDTDTEEENDEASITLTTALSHSVAAAAQICEDHQKTVI